MVLAGITPRMMAGRRKIGFSRSFPTSRTGWSPSCPTTTLPANRPTPQVVAPSPRVVRRLPFRTAWPWVLCVIGLDYLSTLAYQPSVAFGAAGPARAARDRAGGVVTLFLALPMYSTSPAGRPTGAGPPRSWSASSPAGSGSSFCSCCSRSARWTSCSRGRSRPRPRRNTSRSARCPPGSRRSTPRPPAARDCGSNSPTWLRN